jgi:hypothetical protein
MEWTRTVTASSIAAILIVLEALPVQLPASPTLIVTRHPTVRQGSFVARAESASLMGRLPAAMTRASGAAMRSSAASDICQIGTEISAVTNPAAVTIATTAILQFRTTFLEAERPATTVCWENAGGWESCDATLRADG